MKTRIIIGWLVIIIMISTVSAYYIGQQSVSQKPVIICKIKTITDTLHLDWNLSSYSALAPNSEFYYIESPIPLPYYPSMNNQCTINQIIQNGLYSDNITIIGTYVGVV